MKITLRQLKHALALEQHGSFHRAAAAEAISQPAFSRSISRLEETLGVPLFDRNPPRVLPTAFGRVLLRRGREVVNQTEEISREINLLQGLFSGYLTVAMGIFAAEFSATAALGELVRRHPGIHCRSRLTDWRSVLGWVLEGVVEIGMIEISAVQGHPAVDVSPMGQHPFVFFCRAGHPLLDGRDVTREGVDAFPFAVPRLPARARALLPGVFEIEPENGDLIPALEVEDLASARAIVLASDAISTAAPLQIEDLVRQGRVSVLPLWQPGLNSNYGFIWQRDRMLSPAAEMFMDIVRELEVELAQRNLALFEEFCPASRRKPAIKA